MIPTPFLDQTAQAILLYIRLVSYPASMIGTIWLMMFRHDWRRRPTSLFFVSLVILYGAQFGTVLARIFAGERAAVFAQDALITPALIGFNVALWASIIWLARRWRHEPDKWV